MTTNQTIDGVPRELLESMLEISADQWSRADELRALLDAPAVENELDRLRAENERLLAGFYQQVTDADIKKISDYMGNPDMPTGAFLRQDAYDLANMTTHMCREVQALRNKLAAQHQGEPVAWMYKRKDQSEFGKPSQHIAFASPDLEECRTGKNVDGRLILTPRDDYFDWRPLYAEQPAPVAVVLAEARTWLGDGLNSDGLAQEYWTPEYAALIERIDATLRNTK